MSSRRNFIRNLGSAALVSASPLSTLAAGREDHAQQIPWPKKISANDRIRIAGIGLGIQGYQNIEAALRVTGTELVACSDLYSGRRVRAQEVFGSKIVTTGNYEEILDRSDVDAVIISTHDSSHATISKAALAKGKAVYCEKPMVHRISEGWDVINAQNKSGKVFQVGSQRISGLVFAKAKELYQAGAIGQINTVEAVNNRQSALGAWQYTIPLDASPQTVDWERYQLTQQEKEPFDQNKFFRWRNYRHYGTGMAGDLFVHLLTGLHFITGSKGPSRISSMGQLTYWKDGRDVPDVLSSIMEYPETPEHPAFLVTLRVNFVSGEGDNGYTRITGSDGVMIVSGSRITVKRRKMPLAPGIGGWDSLGTFTEDMQRRLKEDHKRRYSNKDQQSEVLPDIVFAQPKGFSDHDEHLRNFIDSVRFGKPVVEDAVFGFRATAPCLASNESYFQNRIIEWDAEKMRIKQL